MVSKKIDATFEKVNDVLVKREILKHFKGIGATIVYHKRTPYLVIRDEGVELVYKVKRIRIIARF